MSGDIDGDLTWSEKLAALYRVGKFRPKFVVVLVGLSFFAALLEGVGMGFIVPIVKVAQGQADPSSASGVLAIFITMYDIMNIPFTLGYLVVGITAVLMIRYTLSFLVAWARTYLVNQYLCHLQSEAFTGTLGAKIEYFDSEGSDRILNAIVTQAEYAARAIRFTVDILENLLLMSMYAVIALVIAPGLTIATAGALALLALLFRGGLSTGYSLGDEVADANSEIHRLAQTATQGIRTVRLFGMENELESDFEDAINKYAEQRVRISRNSELINKYYTLTTAVTVFVLIYVGISLLSMSLALLGLFLFAIFRLGPRVSNLNSMLYNLEGNLPHLVRTQQFVDELDREAKMEGRRTEIPDSVGTITFDDVVFSYDSSNSRALRNIDFTVRKGEWVGFVGPSGAGKSSITSLLARSYTPDSGEIRANGTPIRHFDPKKWRARISIVRQKPYIFNDTLKRNITIGRRNVDQDEIEKICDVAQVTEFLDERGIGYDSIVGEDGVKLSGGQRQRVAIARALLPDTDFLILDEATSELDMTLEHSIHRRIEDLDRDIGLIVITHRLSTVRHADRIYTMEAGEIVERGTHQELVDEGGKYTELYDHHST